MERGLIHVYCGGGKGKTTAAIGLAVRALGADLSVLFVQFLKTNKSAELNILRNLKSISIADSPSSLPFYFNMAQKEKDKYKKYALGLFHSNLIKAAENDFDLLILDEILDCVDLGIIDSKEILTFLNFKPKKLEVVLTGRNVGDEIISISDYVSKIEPIKHPFNLGQAARRGIEY